MMHITVEIYYVCICACVCMCMQAPVCMRECMWDCEGICAILRMHECARVHA